MEDNRPTPNKAAHVYETLAVLLNKHQVNPEFAQAAAVALAEFHDMKFSLQRLQCFLEEMALYCAANHPDRWDVSGLAKEKLALLPKYREKGPRT